MLIAVSLDYCSIDLVQVNNPIHNRARYPVARPLCGSLSFSARPVFTSTAARDWLAPIVVDADRAE
jgi:hypothetical protein